MIDPITPSSRKLHTRLQRHHRLRQRDITVRRTHCPFSSR